METEKKTLLPTPDEEYGIEKELIPISKPKTFPDLLNDKYNHDGTSESLKLAYAKYINDVLNWHDGLVAEIQNMLKIKEAKSDTQRIEHKAYNNAILAVLQKLGFIKLRTCTNSECLNGVIYSGYHPIDGTKCDTCNGTGLIGVKEKKI